MSGNVYFLKPVGLRGPIKIGLAKTPRSRLRQYVEWSPIPLELILTIEGDLALERNIHECFVDCHSHAEWFHAMPHLVTAIAAMQSGAPVSEAIDLSNRKGSIRKAKMAVCARRKGTSQETVSP
jgi:hypothetical protein